MKDTVLIVDDAVLYRAILIATVYKLGCNAEFCDDGTQALKRLTANADSYASILLDIHAPQIDGISVLGHIRGNWPSLPVVMISENEDSADIDAVLKLGAANYLRKPFTPEKIYAELEKILPENKALYVAAGQQNQ